MNKRDKRAIIFFIILVSIAITGFFIAKHNRIKEKVYIQKTPQVSEIKELKEPVYIDVYTAPCRDNPEIECIYITVYPNMREEVKGL